MSFPPTRVLLALLVPGLAHPAFAADGEGGHSLNLLLENDAYMKSILMIQTTKATQASATST